MIKSFSAATVYPSPTRRATKQPGRQVKWVSALTCLLACAACARGGEKRAPREFSVDLWDWTVPCRDLPTFKVWAGDLKKIGVTRVEISAPWNLMEPQPGRYDLSFIADRLAVVRSLGMGLRVRINSYYSGATPAWYKGDSWRDIEGKPPTGTEAPPSIVDERFWSHYAPMCTRIAAAFKGDDVYFNCFIGVQAELKWADWWSYDASTLALWRKVIRQRPPWLLDVAGNAELPDVPPIPRQTHGVPDNSPISKGWIAFREHVWRDAIARFTAAIRAGDSNAKISAPLGESFRRQSAQFSNLDYWGLSRGADQIVHSYDFYWHARDPAWDAAAAVASFRGITGISNIDFEFDGPGLVQNLGYSQIRQLRIADAALSQGAGLQAANYSGGPRLPSAWPVLVSFGNRAAASRPIPDYPARQTTLLFLSKWANYCYREKTEWLHDAQFGAWRMLTSRGLPVRIICEDNLDEDLSHYHGLYVAFSPPELIPISRRDKLDSLLGRIPSVVELSATPTGRPTTRPIRAGVVTGRWMTLNCPLAYHWLRGDRASCKDLLDHCVGFLAKGRS